MITSVNAEVHFEECTQELEALEVHLKEMAPVSMPANMLDRMAQAMDQWHETESDSQNVIGFSDDEFRTKAKSKLLGVGFLSAAAAVALLAAMTALVIPDLATKKTKLIAQNAPLDFNAPNSSNRSSNIRGISAPSIASGNAVSLSPAAEILTSKVINSKETIIYDDDQNPFRFVEVEYMDQVKVKSSDGRDVILSRPRKDGYLIPIKVY